MRIGIGSDQSGWECKEGLKARLTGQGHAAEDVSMGNQPRSDYQRITGELSSAIYTGRVERGVLICSRAIGACVMANKHPGVRAALCHDLNSARQGVQDEVLRPIGLARWRAPLSLLSIYVPSRHLAFLRDAWRSLSSTSGRISTHRWPSERCPGWRR